MEKIFSVQDRQNAFEFVLSAARENDRIIALVQVGSGAAGYRDDRSDLDFVIALDSGPSTSADLRTTSLWRRFCRCTGRRNSLAW